uniref:Uncharacterized protein n=1 Tax=Acrobeloides nanus TaxID=290746 RepID=A0A914E333_9BILA
MNKLSRQILKSTTVHEEWSAEYISSQDEETIIKSLLGILEEQQVSASELTKEQWDSVFWQDHFTRPDIQTEFCESVFKYDQSTQHFKYSSDKANEFKQNLIEKKGKSSGKSVSGEGGFDFLGIICNSNKIKLFILFIALSVSGGSNRQNSENSESVNQHETKTKESFSKDELVALLKQNKMDVKWTGEKFTPKALNLYRVNIRALLSKGEILYKRVVKTTLPVIQKIEFQPEAIGNGDVLTVPSIYEEMRILKEENKRSSKLLENALLEKIEGVNAKLIVYYRQLSIVENRCFNLGPDAQNGVNINWSSLYKASGSIDTRGNCVILYDGDFCTGIFVKFDETCSNGCCHNFPLCNPPFVNKAKSYKSC